jgi:hypothetical protein
MIVYVELHAFRLPGEAIPVRAVEVDSPESAPLAEVLEETFRLGQNDNQPQPMRSVSVGDVVLHAGRRFRVAMVGFREERLLGIPDGSDLEPVGETVLDACPWHIMQGHETRSGHQGEVFVAARSRPDPADDRRPARHGC